MANRKDSKGRVLRKGESERNDGRYVFQYRDTLGKACCIYSKELNDLREKVKQIQKDLEDGIRTDKGKMSFSDLFDEFMESKSREIKQSSATSYKQIFDLYIKNTALAKKSVSSIQNIDVKRYVYGLQDRKLSRDTIRSAYGLVSSVLAYAETNDYVRRNVAKGAMPKMAKETKGKTPLTEAQVHSLIEFCKNHTRYKRYVPFLVVACNTGLRVGEITGMTWDNVDLKKKELYVVRQLRYWGYEGEGWEFHIATPKTKAGFRTIALTDATVTALIELKKYYMACGIRCKTVVDGITDFVFLTDNGTPYTGAGVNLFLKRIEDAYNEHEDEVAQKEKRSPEHIPHISAHILRHTTATILFQKGVNAKAVQGILGHSNFSTTMNTYTHAENDVEWIASELQKVGNVVNG